MCVCVRLSVLALHCAVKLVLFNPTSPLPDPCLPAQLILARCSGPTMPSDALSLNLRHCAESAKNLSYELTGDPGSVKVCHFQQRPSLLVSTPTLDPDPLFGELFSQSGVCKHLDLLVIAVHPWGSHVNHACSVIATLIWHHTGSDFDLCLSFYLHSSVTSMLSTMNDRCGLDIAPTPNSLLYTLIFSGSTHSGMAGGPASGILDTLILISSSCLATRHHRGSVLGFGVSCSCCCMWVHPRVRTAIQPNPTAKPNAVCPWVGERDRHASAL